MGRLKSRGAKDMITKFHKDSQTEMLKPISDVRLHRRHEGMEPISNVIDHMRKRSGTEHRSGVLAMINERRRIIYESPNNEWGVYELCKLVYELACIDNVDFNGNTYGEKCSFIRQLVPFANIKAVTAGVIEYHESRKRDEQQTYVSEAMQLSQTILLSFIQKKGMMREFQAYVADFELTGNGQETR
jgi:hypothetical protein